MNDLAPQSTILSPNETAERFVSDFLRQSAEGMAHFAQDTAAIAVMHELAGRITQSLAAGGKLLVAGNGGSAADAQHIAGEFTARLMYDRRPLAAIALTTDSSSMTAIGNDYGFSELFARQVAALGRPGDVFLGITTSGRSPNVLRALETAREMGVLAVAFTCANPAPELEADIMLKATSDWTPIVQQLHITAAHVVCGLVERALCPRAGVP